MTNEELDLEIQKILEPYFCVLDGGDNEPAMEIVTEISEKILELLNNPYDKRTKI